MIKSLKEAKNVLIAGHIRPDGDCIGSGLAIKHLCDSLGINADFSVDSDIPESYMFMPGAREINSHKFNNYDLFIAVDCADAARLGRYAEYAETVYTVNVDHHYTNPSYGNKNYIVADACSTCEILYGMIREAGLLNKTIAECLYVGLSTDTGHFMHANTTEKTFLIAAGLAAEGIDVSGINNMLYNSVSRNKLALTSRAIGSIEYFENGDIAFMTIYLSDLKQTGCTTDDTEGLIAYATSIKGVKVSVCVCEQADGTFRVSLRSKGANVAKAAAVFGGGGHERAAGCILRGKRDDVARKLISAIKVQL